MRRSRSKQKNNFNKYVLICAFIALFAIILAATGMFVHAGENSNKEYISIEIEEDDTLWDIATRYYDEDAESINEYISNIKKINGLSSDNITSGNFLIVYTCN